MLAVTSWERQPEDCISMCGSDYMHLVRLVCQCYERKETEWSIWVIHSYCKYNSSSLHYGTTYLVNSPGIDSPDGYIVGLWLWTEQPLKLPFFGLGHTALTIVEHLYWYGVNSLVFIPAVSGFDRYVVSVNFFSIKIFNFDVRCFKYEVCNNISQHVANWLIVDYSHITVATSTTPAEIVTTGQELFFPGGASARGTSIHLMWNWSMYSRDQLLTVIKLNITARSARL